MDTYTSSDATLHPQSEVASCCSYNTPNPHNVLLHYGSCLHCPCFLTPKQACNRKHAAVLHAAAVACRLFQTPGHARRADSATIYYTVFPPSICKQHCFIVPLQLVSCFLWHFRCKQITCSARGTPTLPYRLLITINSLLKLLLWWKVKSANTEMT